jgi:hypothetical protein
MAWCGFFGGIGREHCVELGNNLGSRAKLRSPCGSHRESRATPDSLPGFFNSPWDTVQPGLECVSSQGAGDDPPDALQESAQHVPGERAGRGDFPGTSLSIPPWTHFSQASSTRRSRRACRRTPREGAARSRRARSALQQSARWAWGLSRDFPFRFTLGQTSARPDALSPRSHAGARP